MLHNWQKNWNALLMVLNSTLFRFVEQYWMIIRKKTYWYLDGDEKTRNIHELQKIFFVNTQNGSKGVIKANI